MSNTHPQGFLSRFWTYQSERFPFLAHGPLIAVFSFSAIAYSRLCRGATGFIDWKIYLAGVFCTVTLFLLVRIFDEHKDAEDDALYRPELPVPRGLISLSELRRVGHVVFVLQLLVITTFFPKMFWFFGIVLAYLCLMGVEFFVPDWLRRHQFWYVTSHMFIIPLVDVFASGLDWYLGGFAPPAGLLFFFLVSYLNGIVLEIGRKIRPPRIRRRIELHSNAGYPTRCLALAVGVGGHVGGCRNCSQVCRFWLWHLYFSVGFAADLHRSGFDVPPKTNSALCQMGRIRLRTLDAFHVWVAGWGFHV